MMGDIKELSEEGEWVKVGNTDISTYILPTDNLSIIEGKKDIGDVYNPGGSLVEGKYMLNKMLHAWNVIELCKEQVRYVLLFKLGAGEVVPDLSMWSSPWAVVKG